MWNNNCVNLTDHSNSIHSIISTIPSRRHFFPRPPLTVSVYIFVLSKIFSMHSFTLVFMSWRCGGITPVTCLQIINIPRGILFNKNSRPRHCQIYCCTLYYVTVYTVVHLIIYCNLNGLSLLNNIY